MSSFLTALVALALAAVATKDATRAVGVGVHHLDSASVARLDDLGVRHFRYTLYWSHWSEPAYRDQWEQGLRRALDAGLEPLIVVHQPPSGSFEQRDHVYHAFARFVAERAAQFPEIRAWQLWNEMDESFTDVFGAGRPEVSLRQRGRLYAAMLELAYPAVKRANPEALVVTGGIASAVDGGFLDGLYDGNAPYDVLAVHTYGYPLAISFGERGRTARRIMAAHGDTRPLWNTEFGLESSVIPEHPYVSPASVDDAHLTAWKTSIESHRTTPLYDRIYGHVLAEGKDLGFALVRVDGSTRPAYQWLRSLMRRR